MNLGILSVHTSSTATRICRCNNIMPKNARRSLGGNAAIFSDTSTTSTASTTKSAIRRRRKLRLLCRSQNWMAVPQWATGKPASSIFIFTFTMDDFAMANELELMATYIIWEMVVTSVSWKEVQKLRGVVTGHPLTKHICAEQSVHKRGTHTTRLAQVTRIAVSSLCAWKVESSGVAHVSPVVALSPPDHFEHIIFLNHSSFYHDTRTRSTTGATRSPPRTHSSSCASPSSPSRQAAPWIITLAWKPAEWPKPAHDNPHRNNIFLVLWHGRSREELCGKTLRTCK